MKKNILLISMILGAGSAFSQIESFESVTLDSGKVLNGSEGKTEYVFNKLNSDLILPVHWDTSFGGLWSSGWAISRKYDSASIGSDAGRHLYCAKPFKGVGGSNTYIVGQQGSYLYRKPVLSNYIESFYISNSTYAFNSMRFGDAFAKKFGGKTGNDSDYFYCRIKSFKTGNLLDSQDVYLADFRFSDNNQDYILSEWKKVNTPQFTDSVTFELYSSDNSSWGMNTPAFFVLDELNYGGTSGVADNSKTQLNLYPNPVINYLNINSEKIVWSAVIFNESGQELYRESYDNASAVQIQTDKLKSGKYFIILNTEGGFISRPFIKK